MKIMKTMMIVGSMMISSVLAAQTLTYRFNDPFTNDVVPSGSEPWLLLTLTEYNTYTQMEITSSLKNGSEFISSIGLDLNPNFSNYNSLTFSKMGGVGSYDDPNITVGDNIFNAGGGERFDIKLEFQTSDSHNGNGRFNNSDSILYKIGGANLNTFSSSSAPVMMAHVQGIGKCADESTWLVPTPSIPEPSALSISSIGVFLLLRRRNSK